MKKNQVSHRFSSSEMKDLVFWAFIVFCVMILGFCLIGCNPVEHLNDQLEMEDDHLVEEVVEEVIDAAAIHYIGFDPNVELTPRSPE